MLSLSLRRVGCVVGLSLAFVSSAFAVDRRVPQDFPTIQDAVNAAENGDDIVVSPGNWDGFSVSGKSLKVRSTGSFATTRITSSCSVTNAPNGFEFESITVLQSTLSNDSGPLTLDRLRMVGGSVQVGGNSRFIVADSEFVGTQLSGGATGSAHSLTGSSFRSGASVSLTGDSSLANCDFVANSSAYASGTLSLSNSTAQGADNAAYFSGATVSLVDCVFRDIRTQGTPPIGGGSISATRCSFINIRNVANINSPSYGAISGAAVSVTDCSFTDCIGIGSFYWNGWTNVPVGSPGGAIYSPGSLTITNSNFLRCRATTAGADGGAIYATGALVIERSTFTNCGGEATARGGAIAHSSSLPATITDCVFVGNSASSLGGAVFLGSGAATVTRCRFTINTGSNGGAIHFAGGTQFATAFIRESFFSGNNSTSGSNGRDLSVPGGASSLAFLSQNTFCATEAQACSGFYFEKGPNTFGADCADDCDGDGLPDQYELKIGLATDCNDNGIPDSCDFASGGGADCNNNDILDICEIAAGTGADCNNNGLLDACEPDCDGDGIPNSCEITAGAPDCDANGIPDSCQSDCNDDGVIDACAIAAGAADCNTNGIPDSCEIANGSVADFNKDAVPDTCQPSMQFAGLELEIVPIVNRGLDDLFPQTAICYRLYARTTVTGAAVVGLFGNNAHPLTLSAAGGFWQSPFGGDLASQIPCNLSGVLPSAKYDSWFTVGLTCSAGNAVQNTGLDLTAFNNNGGVNDNDGIIFVQPGSPQSIAGASKRVLLAQLTTNSAVLPTGFIDVVGRSASGTVGWEAYNQAIPVPALVDCNNNGQQDAFEIALGTVRDCDQSGVPDTCEFPSASTDCNGNGIPDLCDVVSAFSADLNGNFVPDECECSGDVDGNGRVDVDDIIDVISSWGATGDNPADVNNDNVVGAADLAIVLAGYGSCL